MAGMGQHEQITARRDHLWVLVVIAVCALAEVWGSWVGIGSISGFPVLLGRLPTDWILAMVMEGYWAYGLYAWLAASPGPRSRSFAMWSCAVVFVLSLVGQVTYHEMTVPPDTSIGRRVVVGFVTVLPVTGLALIAVLIHLRHADREEAAALTRAAGQAARQAAIERAEADERTALRAELAGLREEYRAGTADLEAQLAGESTARSEAQREAARVPAAEAAKQAAEAAAEAATSALEAAESARTEADERAATAEAKAARLDRKLAAAAGGKDAGKGRKAPAAEMPGDFDAHAEALSIYLKDPGITGAEIARKTGMSERWGQDRKKEFMSRTAENSTAD